MLYRTGKKALKKNKRPQLSGNLDVSNITEEIPPKDNFIITYFE